MCGRFALTSPAPVLREYFGYNETPEFPPRFNIAPTQPIAVIAARDFTHGRERSFRLVRWGFLPSFAKDVSRFPLLINARAETLMEKPSFSAALKRRRCLVPADGFYVWRDGGRGQAKQPFLIRAVDRGPLGFAGLFETYLDPNGSEIDTACIVTTGANRLVSGLSDRMPAILPREAFGSWLDHDNRAADALALLRPAPETLLDLTPISAAIGDARRDFSELQAPLGPGDTFR